MKDTFWQRAYGSRDITHPVVQVFARQRVELIEKYIPLHTVQRALDVGCGSGFSMFLVEEKLSNVFGVDRSIYMLKKHPSRGCLVLGDAYHLPFPDMTFDLVYAWELIHHFRDPLPVVQEMARVTRRWMFLFEPSRYHPVQFALALFQREHRPIFRFSASFLKHLFIEVGFQNVQVRRVGWIFPNKTPTFLLPLLQRLPLENSIGISYFVIGEKLNVAEK